MGFSIDIWAKMVCCGGGCSILVSKAWDTARPNSSGVFQSLSGQRTSQTEFAVCSNWGIILKLGWATSHCDWTAASLPAIMDFSWPGARVEKDNVLVFTVSCISNHTYFSGF